MYLLGWLRFPTLEKWPFVGDILCVQAAYSPLVTRAVCSRGALYMGCTGPSVVMSELGPKVAGCRAPGGPSNGVDLLMGGAGS